MAQSTPDKVAAQATTAADTPLGGLVLLGVFQRPKGNEALVRSRGDKITRVTVGDKLDGATVVAIGADTLQLARGSDSEMLKIPGG